MSSTRDLVEIQGDSAGTEKYIEPNTPETENIGEYEDATV